MRKSGRQNRGRYRTISIMNNFTFQTSGEIIFGPGSINELPKHTASAKVMLVTGSHFARKSGLIDRVLGLIENPVVFDAVPPEPTLDTLKDGLELCRSEKCGIIAAIGGGSALDTGKAVAALYAAKNPVEEYFGGIEPERGLTFIAVPTTAGSGAEATQNSVFINKKTAVKTSIRGKHMFPDIAIIDPEMAVSLPPETTANSGMDALSQSLESLVSRGSTPLTDPLALDSAVRMIQNLPAACKDPKNIEYRSQLALGCLMGAMAFSNTRLGLIHGMAHPLGVATGLPHGLICALLLPEVAEFNIETSAKKYAQVAREVRIAKEDTGDEEAASRLVAKIREMNEKLGINKRRAEIRVPDSGKSQIVEQSLSAGTTKFNPREPTAADVEKILASL